VCAGQRESEVLYQPGSRRGFLNRTSRWTGVLRVKIIEFWLHFLQVFSGKGYPQISHTSGSHPTEACLFVDCLIVEALEDFEAMQGPHYLGQSLGFAQVPGVYLGHCPRYSRAQHRIFSVKVSLFWPEKVSKLNKLAKKKYSERPKALYSTSQAYPSNCTHLLPPYRACEVEASPPLSLFWFVLWRDFIR